jgi:hypothetical protein
MAIKTANGSSVMEHPALKNGEGHEQRRMPKIDGIRVSAEEGAAVSHFFSYPRHGSVDQITHLHRQHEKAAEAQVQKREAQGEK